MEKLPTMQEVKDDLIAKALARANGHVVKAARMIEVDPATIYRKLQKTSCKRHNQGA